MNILFGNNEVTGIVFFTQPTATIFPMREADHRGELMMEGFSWRMEKRPNKWEDVLEGSGKNQTVPPVQEADNQEVEESDLSTPMNEEPLNGGEEENTN